MMIIRWIAAVFLWFVALLSAVSAGYFFYMEGRFSILCGDDVCEGLIPSAIASTAFALLAIGLGLLVRPRQHHRPR